MNKSLQRTRHLPDFKSKVVSLTLAGEEWARVLVRPRWEVQGDRMFLVGTIPPGGSKNDWCAGATDAVAWEAITAYMLFDSPEHYAGRLAIYHRKQRKR